MQLIGNKETIAVEIEIVALSPSLEGKAILWLNNCPMGPKGDYLGERIYRFIWCINKLSINPNYYQNKELDGVDHLQFFHKRYPTYNDKEAYWDLTEEEQDAIEKLEKHDLSFGGEEFDDWTISALLHDNTYLFIWAAWRDDSYDVRNDIKHMTIPVEEVREVCLQLNALLPSELWSRLENEKYTCSKSRRRILLNVLQKISNLAMQEETWRYFGNLKDPMHYWNLTRDLKYLGFYESVREGGFKVSDHDQRLLENLSKDLSDFDKLISGFGGDNEIEFLKDNRWISIVEQTFKIIPAIEDANWE